MAFNLIVPTIVETQCTGFYGAGEREYRGHMWRAEIRAGSMPIVLRDGVAVPLDSAPRHALELARDTRQALGV